MVRLFVGIKGSGKTKRMIDMANDSNNTSDGSVVFINKDSRLMCNLHYNIRFVSLEDYDIEDIATYNGFIYGILSSNHDIDTIYIDSLLKHANIHMNDVPKFLDKLAKIGEKFNVEFIVSISSTMKELPERVKEYTVLS
ncbi:MAG: hypothetical protein MJA31_10715 [Clostridia bacterium]|nr:hypothetical protein [Clostridia bacterium]